MHIADHDRESKTLRQLKIQTAIRMFGSLMGDHVGANIWRTPGSHDQGLVGPLKIERKSRAETLVREALL